MSRDGQPPTRVIKLGIRKGPALTPDAHPVGFRAAGPGNATTLRIEMTSAWYVAASNAQARSKRSPLWLNPRSVRMACPPSWPHCIPLSFKVFLFQIADMRELHLRLGIDAIVELIADVAKQHDHEHPYHTRQCHYRRADPKPF